MLPHQSGFEDRRIIEVMLMGQAEEERIERSHPCGWTVFGTDGIPLPHSSEAEQEGFEPPVPVGTTVFKTVAFSRSATAP